MNLKTKKNYFPEVGKPLFLGSRSNEDVVVITTKVEFVERDVNKFVVRTKNSLYLIEVLNDY